MRLTGEQMRKMEENAKHDEDFRIWEMEQKAIKNGEIKMTTEKLTQEQAGKIREIAREMNYSFDWRKTKELGDYWLKVHSALLRIAENGLKNHEEKFCDKCGGELK